MFVTYQPEGQEPTKWDFDPGRVRAAEAEMIEKRYGGNWDAWRNDVRSGSAKARRVLLWHLLRRQHHTLRYEDTPDFLMAEVLVEHSVAELVELRDRMMRANLPDADREQMMTAMDIEITDATAREMAMSETTAPGDPEDAADLGGKAPSNNDA